MPQVTLTPKSFIPDYLIRREKSPNQDLYYRAFEDLFNTVLNGKFNSVLNNSVLQWADTNTLDNWGQQFAAKPLEMSYDTYRHILMLLFRSCIEGPTYLNIMAILRMFDSGATFVKLKGDTIFSSTTGYVPPEKDAYLFSELSVYKKRESYKELLLLSSADTIYETNDLNVSLLSYRAFMEKILSIVLPANVVMIYNYAKEHVFFARSAASPTEKDKLYVFNMNNSTYGYDTLVINSVNDPLVTIKNVSSGVYLAASLHGKCYKIEGYVITRLNVPVADTTDPSNYIVGIYVYNNTAYFIGRDMTVTEYGLRDNSYYTYTIPYQGINVLLDTVNPLSALQATDSTGSPAVIELIMYTNHSPDSGFGDKSGHPIAFYNIVSRRYLAKFMMHNIMTSYFGDDFHASPGQRRAKLISPHLAVYNNYPIGLSTGPQAPGVGPHGITMYTPNIPAYNAFVPQSQLFPNPGSWSTGQAIVYPVMQFSTIDMLESIGLSYTDTTSNRNYTIFTYNAYTKAQSIITTFSKPLSTPLDTMMVKDNYIILWGATPNYFLKIDDFRGTPTFAEYHVGLPTGASIIGYDFR